MTADVADMRRHARAVWDAAVAAVDPFVLVRDALAPGTELHAAARQARRIRVVGGGKAGAGMAAGLEAALADRLDTVVGVLNVPAEAVRPLRAVRLHAARPAGMNQPTAAGVAGAAEMLRLLADAGPDDLALCLLSGGGSALLPAPVDGVRPEDKQTVTRLLHACGATIDDMNCVRKHLSRFKGGRLAEAFRGRQLVSLILSDVVGDPLDVIASGPTAADPTTWADVVAVLDRYALWEHLPPAVREVVRAGQAGKRPDTPKVMPANVRNVVLGNNARALAAAAGKAEELGYRALNLGSFIEGDTAQAAVVLAGVVRSIRRDGQPLAPPVCLLSGGETTVQLPPGHGKGGRNQEFVLAAALKLGRKGMRAVVVLSGGTDGEDGPTDAAGAVADAGLFDRAAACGLAPAHFLTRHDAYALFDGTGDLLRTGLTGTNATDVRVVLIRSVRGLE